MSKKNQESITEQAGISPSNNPAAHESMESFLQQSGLADEFGAGERVTLNIWEPQEGQIRAIEYLGMETRESSKGEFATTEFDIHYAVDLKTHEDFSFIGGGLFSWTIRERQIQKGDNLLIRYRGIIPIDDGRRQAKQWEIRRLKARQDVK